MSGIAWAILTPRSSPELKTEADRILAERQVPPGVDREAPRRFKSRDPKALFDFVVATLGKMYREGRRATLGGRGALSVRAGIAFDEQSDDALQRAFALANEAADDTILADDALVSMLDPLAALPFDRTSMTTVDGRIAYQTFTPDRRDCFVVMPMGKPDTEVRARSETVLDLLVRPACQRLKLRPVAPTRQTGSDISVDIFGALHLSSLVVAYLGSSQWNPNVMIEAGYRLALGRPLVLVADEKPPFDIQGKRAIILADDWMRDVSARVDELVERMRDELSNGPTGGDLYPTAEIEIDERPVPDARKHHKVAAASEATAKLFGLPQDVLVGMPPADLIAHLGDLMGDSHQFAAFNKQQADLYQQLSPMGPLAPNAAPVSDVTATVPLTFFNHPEKTYNGRAFLPYVINQTRAAGIASRQRVVYLEVTRAVQRLYTDFGEIRVCDLKKTNSSLAFELYAKSYDQILNRLTNYKEVRDRHVSAILEACAHCNGEANVLDIGAGTGNVTVPLAEHGLHVCAIDRSQAMLDRLLKKVNGRDNCVVQRHDCRSLRTFNDKSFDGVTMSLVLFAIGARDGARDALLEAVRVLKPGGIIVITEPKADFYLPPLLDQAHEELRSQPDWPTLAPHWEAVFQANSMIDPKRNEFLPAEEIREELGKARLERVETREAYRGNCWTMTAWKPDGLS